jgi:hypothetical protein
LEPYSIWSQIESYLAWQPIQERHTQQQCGQNCNLKIIKIIDWRVITIDECNFLYFLNHLILTYLKLPSRFVAINFVWWERPRSMTDTVKGATIGA